MIYTKSMKVEKKDEMIKASFKHASLHGKDGPFRATLDKLNATRRDLGLNLEILNHFLPKTELSEELS